MKAGEISARSRIVLTAIRRHGSVSRSVLIHERGLSGTAIFRATEELAAAGLVRAGDSVAAGRGQPSTTIHIEPDAAFALGLSVMTDRADVVLLDLAGAIRATEILEWVSEVYLRASALGTPKSLDLAAQEEFVSVVTQRGYGRTQAR